MTTSSFPKFAETPCDVSVSEHTSASGRKIMPQKSTTNSISLNDSILLSPINRHHCHDPTSGLQIKLKSRMSFYQTDDQFTGSLNDPARNVDERKPNRLHPPGCPRTSQNQTLHDRVEVHRQNHDPPPGGILAKIPRRQLAPRQNPPSSPSAPPPTSRNAPDANGSISPHPNPCWSPDRTACNAEDPSATSERETPAAACPGRSIEPIGSRIARYR